jgi:acetylornithine deacetylase
MSGQHGIDSTSQSTSGDPPDRRVLELLERLVAFDTTSRNSNLELIEFTAGLLTACGASCATVFSPDGRKANLLATIGPDDRGGVLLSGHSDVVPVDGQHWRTDPFVLTEHGERFYGRGSCDMKGFLAVVLAAAPDFARARLARPLQIAVTYDEEVGCLGVPVLIDAMREMPVLPRLCIVGEPTRMRVAVGHKGARAYHARFRGRESHSSLAPLSVNAVEHAADLVTRLTALGRRFASDGPRDDDYEVGHTTVHTGVIRGGTQVNIVPADCEVEFEYRPLPEQDGDAPETLIRGWVEEEITPAMRAVNPECGVELARRYAYPGLATDPQAEVARLAGELAMSGEPIKIAFGTEAGCYQAGLGIPSVVCGPGSIRQAHQPDEYVEAAQLAACERFMGRLLEKLSSP